MATEEKVVIKVEVDADISNDIAAIRNRLKAIEDRMGSFNRTAKNMDRGLDRVNKRFDKMGNVLRKVTQVFLKFTAALAKFSFIALAGQIGLFTAGLLAAKAALVTGRAAVSAYQASLRGLSVAAAGVATAMAVAAAAMRQFNEAQLGSQFGGGPQGRLNAVRATRGIDSRSAGLLGREATAAIAGSLGRAGVRPGQTGNIVRQLYNISGGDAKAAQSLAAAMGSGDLDKARTSLRSAVGFNQGSLANVSTMRGLMGVVAGGGATGANFRSVGEDMASTFVGTLKTEFSGLVNVFADLGAPLLEPFRQSFVNISRILREDVLAMSVALQKFGAESFAPTIESFMASTSDFIRKNIIANIGNVKEMGQSFVDFGKAVKEFFADIGDFLGRLEPAADVVMDMFRALGDAAGGRGLFQQFNRLVVENAEAFKDFGASIGNVIGALFDQLSGGQMGFFNKLPLLADVFNTLANRVIPALFDVFNRFAPLMERLPGALESLANVLEMLAPIVGTLVSAVNTLVGGLQSMGGLGDIGTVALMAGFMMMTKGRGRSMLGRGARNVAAGGSGARAITSASTVTRASAANMAAINANIASGVHRRGRLAGSFLNLRNSAHTSLTAGRGAGFFGRAGKLGALAFGLEGLNMIGDYRDGGFSGIASGYNQRATDSPIFAGLSTGSAASFIAGPQIGLGVGGATTLLGAVNQGLAGNNSIGNTLTGALGGAALGASIGSFGGPLGMAAGAVVGGIIGGVGTFFAGRKGQERLKKASRDAAGQVQLDIAAFEVGSGSAAFNTLANQQELLMKAREVAIDDKGNYVNEGDTKEFQDFVRSLGIDPNSIHLDEFFKEIMSDNTLVNMEDRLLEAERLYTDQMQSIANQTGLSMEEVERVINDFNIDPFMDYMEDNVAAVINFANRTVADLNQVFLPNFFTSQQQKNELLATNQAQLNDIVSGYGATGTVTTEQAMDFLSTQTQINMANGMTPTQASLTAIQAFGFNMRENLGSGAAVGILESLGLDRNGSVMQALLGDIVTELGFDEMGLTANDVAGSLYGGNFMFMKNDLGFKQLTEQAQAYQAMVQGAFSGDVSQMRALAGTGNFAGTMLTPEGATAFMDLVTQRSQGIMGPIVESTFNTSGSDGGRNITFDEIIQAAENLNFSEEELQSLMAQMNTDLTTQVDALGATIVDGLITAGRPVVSINGDLETTERGTATYVITTEVTATGGSGGDYPFMY
jgi:hypothetical protein